MMASLELKLLSPNFTDPPFFNSIVLLSTFQVLENLSRHGL